MNMYTKSLAPALVKELGVSESEVCQLLEYRALWQHFLTLQFDSTEHDSPYDQCEQEVRDLEDTLGIDRFSRDQLKLIRRG